MLSKLRIITSQQLTKPWNGFIFFEVCLCACVFLPVSEQIQPTQFILFNNMYKQKYLMVKVTGTLTDAELGHR